MQADNILDLINAIEREFPVDRWRARDVHLWPLVRIPLAWNLNKPGEGAQSSQGLMRKIAAAGRKLSTFSRYVLAAAGDRRHNAAPRHRVDALFLGDGVSRVFLQGAWYDKLCDPFVDALERKGKSCFHIELNDYYITPRHRASMFAGARFELIKMRTGLLAQTEVPGAVQADGYASFVDFLKSRGIGIGPFGLDAVVRRVAVINAFREYFTKMLHTLMPSIGFMVDYPATECMGFSLACRDLSIPSVVIQHGVQGDYNEAYGRWMKVPDGGYGLLPSIFWCWTAEDAERVNAWSSRLHPLHHALAGGNLFLLDWQDGKNPFAGHYDDVVTRLRGNYPADLHILVTLQYGLADRAHLERLLISIKQAPSQWRWWIRLHPMMKNDRPLIQALFADFGITNYEMEQTSVLPLYALLKNMDIHVTLHSATVIEAESFNMPSVIIHEKGSLYFQDQIRAGSAIAAFSPSEIVRAISDMGRSRGMRREKGRMVACMDSIDELFLLAGRVRERLIRSRQEQTQPEERSS